MDDDESTFEINQLLKKLDSKKSKHNDRVRALNRFRNFVSNTKNSPEFYDDDIPFLLIGTKEDNAVRSSTMPNNVGGLFHACGSVSDAHKGSLKRSARTAMSLLKYLVCDFVEVSNGKPTGEENLFASSFFEVNHYHLLLFESHISGDSSNRAAKDDACGLLCEILMHSKNSKSLTDFLPTSDKACTEFEKWVAQNKSKTVQQALKKHNLAGPTSSNSKLLKKQPSGDALAHEKKDGDILGAFTKRKKVSAASDEENDEQDEHASTGVQPHDRSFSYVADGRDGPPTAWVDSELAKEDLTRASLERALEHDKVQREADLKRQEEEKQRLLRKDPLGIREDLDLLYIEEKRVELIESTLEDVEQEMDLEFKNETRGQSSRKGERDPLASLEAQRDALEAILDGRNYSAKDGDDPSEEAIDVQNRSVLPTESSFDPLLFLTLAHRNADFDQLQKSIARITNKTDNQMQRLQNLVRDNFELFVRCADNVDLFSKEDDKLNKKGSPTGVKDRLDHLEFLAGSCSNQAKSSFKPLLDNTNEVRKVQSALAVLQRIAPLLQIPSVMRQHMENGRFSQAIKSYRRIFAIKDDIQMELLQDVKIKAEEAAEDVRRDLETTLSNPNVPIQTLLDAIRDLDELIELESQHEDDNTKVSQKNSEDGKFTVGENSINVRKHPPALACLLLQTAHFSLFVDNSVRQSERASERIYAGESLASLPEMGSPTESKEPEKESKSTAVTPGATPASVSSVATTATTVTETNKSYAESSTKSSERRERNRWKYDMLEARVVSTIRAVAVARTWLPRLLGIGIEAHEAEKRSFARRRNQRIRPKFSVEEDDNDPNKKRLTAMDVITCSVDSSATRLIEHTAFCALGCLNHNHPHEELKMTYGLNADDRLQMLLKAPLPPAQSAKCATELAVLMEVVKDFIASAGSLKPNSIEDGIQIVPSVAISHRQPLEGCRALAEDAVVTIERRQCIYAFDVCARNCSMRASGSGTLDGDSLLLCVQKLGEELTRPEECSNEVEKGCEIVVRRCCEGLASYVRARGDIARLRAVAECANALDGRLVDVVREVGYLTDGQCLSLEDALIEDILALEGVLFDEFLDNLRSSVGLCARLSPEFNKSREENDLGTLDSLKEPLFAPYLSASLLAIVRCRAQVERALGANTIRRSQATTYLFLAMSTAADSVVDAICYQLKERQSTLSKKHADKFSNELQFLVNTLRRYLSDQYLNAADDCRRMLLSIAGRDSGFHGIGPDGLGAIEELERLGRVYVLCLGD